MIFALAAPPGAAGDLPVPHARPGGVSAAKTAAQHTDSQTKSAPGGTRPEKSDGTSASTSDAPAGTGSDDLAGAIPLKDIHTLPTPEAQAEKLHAQMRQQMPAVVEARKNSLDLSRETADIKEKLVATAAKIEHLEDRQLKISGTIARLTAENAILSRDFHKDSGTVTRQLATLERLAHTMPPAMVLKSGDVVTAARAAMLMGATLPKVYQRTAALARRLERIRDVRAQLTQEQTEARRTAADLRENRAALDALLKIREAEAETAAKTYESLRAAYIAAADQAASLDALLNKIAKLKKQPATRGWVSVSANPARTPEMVRPVSGQSRNGGTDGVGGASAPGMTYTSVSGAQVVAPADGRIRYAGPYQKSGLVLILEMANGYDAVLAGLGRVSVHTGDRVLAGEPVGRLPAGSHMRARLYFELRHNGQGLNPARFIDAG